MYTLQLRVSYHPYLRINAQLDNLTESSELNRHYSGSGRQFSLSILDSNQREASSGSRIIRTPSITYLYLPQTHITGDPIGASRH